MTTPNAAEEFMRSLDQHPEIEQELRRRLLTQELLDLPNTVGKLATAISEMRAIFDRRLTSLESQQSENTEQLNSISRRSTPSMAGSPTPRAPTTNAQQPAVCQACSHATFVSAESKRSIHPYRKPRHSWSR